MAVLITVSSILIITAVVAALNRFLPFPLCPICSGVSATWLFLTAFVIAGFLEREAFMPLVLLLMGGTVVGISYQGERALLWARENPLLWKTLVIIAGMPAAFWAASRPNAGLLAAEAMILGALAYIFFLAGGSSALAGPEKKSVRIDELEKKMKDCC